MFALNMSRILIVHTMEGQKLSSRYIQVAEAAQVSGSILTFCDGHNSFRTTSSIAQFLNVNWQTVRNALLTYGIVAPQANPFAHHSPNDLEGPDPSSLASDDFLDPQNSTTQYRIISYTGPLSDINDSDLDTLI